MEQDGPRHEQIEQAAARVAVQEQTVAGLEDRLAKYTIRAPFTGFVSAELTEAGAWIKQGDPIAEVVEIDPVEIEVYVPEAMIRFARRGGTCDVSVEARPEEIFHGTIDQIVPLGDRLARTFPVRVVVANPMTDSGHKLLPGMLAHATLPTDEKSNQLLVHKDALRLGESTTVMRVHEGKAEIIPVRTGASLGSWVAVISSGAGQAVRRRSCHHARQRTIASRTRGRDFRTPTTARNVTLRFQNRGRPFSLGGSRQSPANTLKQYSTGESPCPCIPSKPAFAIQSKSRSARC